MSNVNLLDLLTEGQKAKLFEQFLLTEGASQSEAPSESEAPLVMFNGEAVEWKDWFGEPASREQKQKLISEADKRVWLYDGKAVTEWFVDPEGVCMDFDGKQISFADLLDFGPRPDGARGRHFPSLWDGEFTKGELSSAIQRVLALPEHGQSKPKASTQRSNSSGGRRAAKASPEGADLLAALPQLISTAVSQQLAAMGLEQEPAKPVPATGVVKAPKVPVTKPDAPKVHRPGDSIWVLDRHGKAVERFLSSDGKRLNATK